MQGRFGLAIGLAVLVAAGCGVQRVNINGEAMAPTLKNGESVLATPSFERLDRGDIVAFKYPQDESKSFVKRIVGVPGDRIEMANGAVAINGQPLDEPYVVEANRSKDSWGPISVPEGQYFMMGDNRRNSSDSRMWGAVKREAIWAKLMVRQ